MKPNLFHFATSELSQDAFICWLLSWADPKFKPCDASLHRLGLAFLGKLLEMCNVPVPSSVASVEVHKQYIVLKLRNGGNFDYERQRWISTKQLTDLI